MSSLSFSVLRHKDFRLYLLMRVFAIMAMQTQAVIVGWQVYSLSHSVFLLGMIGLTEAVPAIACAFFAGHIVDISRPHRVNLICMAGMTLNTFTLLLMGGGYISLESSHLLPLIFATIFVSGILRSFIMPSSVALLGQIMPREDMAAVQGWSGSSFQFASVSGPAIAGLVYGGYGPSIAWLLPAVLLSLSTATLLGISHEIRHYRSQKAREPALKSILAGWSFMLGHPVLLAVMALDMFAVLFGGATAMLPAFADQVLHVGSEGLGLLRAAPALGAVGMALFLAVKPLKQIHTALLLWMVAGFGCAMIGFGLSTHFAVAALCLVASGAFDSVSVIIRGTLVQWLTPDEMKGRVSSVSSMFIISSNEIGAFESGLAARALGLVPSIILGGIGTLLVVGLTAALRPELRRMVINAEEKKG